MISNKCEFRKSFHFADSRVIEITKMIEVEHFNDVKSYNEVKERIMELL